MKKLLLSLICLFAIAGVSYAANCGGATPCNCGDTLTSSWTMTGDLACSTAQALIIGGNSITLNLGGYTLSRDGEVGGEGVRALGRTGTTVTNGTISGFTTGIYAATSGTMTLTPPLIFSANATGVQASNVAVTAGAISFVGNTFYGFAQEAGQASTLTGTSFSGAATLVRVRANATVNLVNPTMTTGGVEAATTLVFHDGTNSTLNWTGGTVSNIAATSNTVRNVVEEVATSSVSNISGVTFNVSGWLRPAVRLRGTNSSVKYCAFIDVGSSVKRPVFELASGSGGTISNNTMGGGYRSYGIYSADVDTDDSAPYDWVIANNIITGMSVSAYATASGADIYPVYDVLYGNAADCTSGGGGGACTRANNIDADPKLDANYKLSSGSPAIDAGTAVTGLHTSGSKLITGGDAGGNTKLYGNGIDIGAFERKKFLKDDSRSADGIMREENIPIYYTVP